ncbi:PREDICTED: E3 ubiquitin-protein ligase RNF13-like, partial [Chlamydotis macqueenii]|uniref:E3 ubiquitin-protein ligase RNF13-like n=1 Tax=Chlamydotis macqueenii TaxID=187382 RepID=UPI000529929F
MKAESCFPIYSVSILYGPKIWLCSIVDVAMFVSKQYAKNEADVKGFLINSKPENACEPIAPPPLKDNSSSAFIVLIRRLECNFDIKVLNAQRAGYKAAIVHNVDSDDLISMGSNDIEILKKIDIPSVFIGETSANSLKEEFTYEKGGHVVLIPEFSLPLEYYLIPFLIIVGICLILIVIFM